MFVESNGSFHLESSNASCYGRVIVFHSVDKVSFC